MSDPTWQDRLWYLTWYILIPAALAAALVFGLTHVHVGGAPVIDSPDPWRFLLAFAVFEVVVLGVRDRIYGSKSSHGAREMRTVTAEARELQREGERLLAKAKLSKERRDELDAASKALDEKLKGTDVGAAAKAVREYDQALTKHLGHVRKGTVREYTEAIVFAVVVALVIRTFVVEAFKIPSESMVPTLAVGDNIFVNKFVYGPLLPFVNRRVFQGSPPARGDVVVFVYPVEPNKDFIKRVVGIPGDRVWVREDGSVMVNGRALDRCELGQWPDEDGRPPPFGETARRRAFVEWDAARGRPYLTLYSRDPAEREAMPAEYCVREPCTVPPGHVFVMGDNRDNSSDSRFWGFVPMQNIKGRALWIWFSNVPGNGCDLRYERFGQSILGTPRVPASLQSAFDACMRRR